MQSFDLQVNGYAGVDFNGDDLEAEALRHACARLRADGVAGCLATVITAEPRRMLARLARLAELRAADPEVAATLFGLHVEGPFLSHDPGFAGAHPAAYTHAADVGFLGELLAAGAGLVRLFTLAPERDPQCAVIEACRAAGVTVAAGHTDASLEQLTRALDAGLSVFTHLGNGCPRQLDRHDNIVQRALSLADRLWCCFIADGAHVPFMALGNYLKITGLDRAVVVSDAISAAGLGPGLHPFAGNLVQVGEDLVPRAPGDTHLIGAATTMPHAQANLRAALGLDDPALARLCWTNPRRALGLADAEETA